MLLHQLSLKEVNGEIQAVALKENMIYHLLA